MARILQVTPHPIFPPRGGRRSFFCLRELARVHDVHAIFPQKFEQLQGEKEGYTFPKNVTVHSPLESPPPKTIFDRFPARIGPSLHYRWLRRSLGGPATSEVLQFWHLLRDLCQKHQFDMVIFDHVQTLSAVPLVKRWNPNALRLVNTYNVDSTLYRRLAENESNLEKRQQQLKLSKWCEGIESSLASKVDGYWACSDIDHQQFQSMNSKPIRGYSIANGIATEVLPQDTRQNKREDQRILFCGSLNYEPNRRGLEWFRKHVWPNIKQNNTAARLVVIGLGAAESEFPELRNDPAVDFIGEVDVVLPWYHGTSIAVAPILEGSGTRIKILEAMTLGNPVVSTTVGAEGIDSTDGSDILIRDDADSFGQGILRLLSDDALFRKLQVNGRQLIDAQYDWKVIGNRLNESVREMLAVGRSKRTAPLSTVS